MKGIERIYSVSAVTGNGSCNANCGFCAGKHLRKDAKEDVHYHRSLESAIKLSARYDGWSLSLTGSGEPTCDPDAVTRALETYRKCASQGAYFPNVSLFTNGILFADKAFCDKHLGLWRALGLTNVAVSIQSIDEQEQARAYNLSSYPSLDAIVSNVREQGVGLRGTLLLKKDGVDNAAKYETAVHALMRKGIGNITSWPVVNPDGTRGSHTPSWFNLFGIKRWLHKNAKLCHEHCWGGGVFDYNGTMLRLTDYVTKYNPKKAFVRQLVVFQDGVVAYSWIKEGALCMR
ncbi:MAG TPA: radical SAM protein [Nanoarchaeota archaeon]|nr:radical SAM protein [Nanoarchaeota archaeon]